MKSKQKTRKMVLLALFGCIEVILMVTPLGYIPIGPLRATTLHIPVILAGVLMGPAAAAVIGLIFGISSVVINTMTPTVTSFVFSPFYSIGEFHGSWASLLIAIAPRVLLGVIAGCLFERLNKRKMQLNGCLTVSAMISTFVHTSLVMLGIYVFFAAPYASVKGVTVSALSTMLLTIVLTNGVLEMILAAMIVTAVGRVLLPAIKRK